MLSNDIGLLSINCNFHAKKLAEKVYGDPSCYFSGYDYMSVLKSDRIPYIMGWYCNNRKTLEAQYNLIDCNPHRDCLYQRPAIIHWLGTDIMNAQTLKDIGEVRMFEKLSHGAIINLVHTEEHLAEMMEVMPSATYLTVPLPPYIIHEVTPFEEKPVISVYMPTMRREFFRFEEILRAADHFPEVRFEFYYYYDKFEGDDIPIQNTVNCFFVSAKDEEGMKEQVRRSRAFIRVPIHDGLSVQALEFATAGRSVIYNKHLPFIDEIKPDTTTLVSDLCDKIKLALTREEPMYEMAAHYRKEYGHDAYLAKVAGAVALLKQIKTEGKVAVG